MKRTNEWLIVLFGAGVLGLNYPLLSLFSRKVFLLGIPLLYLYLFAFWTLFILLMALVMRKRKPPRLPSPPANHRAVK